MKLKEIIKTIGLFHLALLSIFFTSCEENLDYVTYDSFPVTFPQTASDANAAINAMYTGLMEGNTWSSGWGAALGSFRVQADQTTDQGICNWGDGGTWANLHSLNFTPDFSQVTSHYTQLMPYISEITMYIDKINNISMDNTLKQRYIGELKALRGYYSQILYLYYGPVPIRTNPADINNASAPVLPRPTKEEMVTQILNDYSDAIDVLPDKFTGSNYGRFSKAVCLTARMKLYMQEKRWQDAINDGEAIKDMGFSLIDDYTKNFSYDNKGGNSEIILPIVCTPTNGIYCNLWLAHALPPDYADPSGIPLTGWGGYRMPWSTYDKFDQNDKRLAVLLQKYPTSNGLRDARAGGDIGAVMVKFGPDPTKTNSQNSGVDYTVFRYADVVLLLAEAINQQNGKPTQEAINLLTSVRTRAGLSTSLTTASTKEQFQLAIENERLFELWAEGVRRDDLIRWGKYISRAVDDGSAAQNPNFGDGSKYILYPLPRSVVNQSNGVIEQNPGYN